MHLPDGRDSGVSNEGPRNRFDLWMFRQDSTGIGFAREEFRGGADLLHKGAALGRVLQRCLDDGAFGGGEFAEGVGGELRIVRGEFEL